MPNLLIIGDLHFSENLGYNHVVKYGRESERQEILDFIVKTFFDNACDGVVFLGDQFDKKNNPSPVVKMFTAFLERFENNPVYIISGNHEKTPAGDSALDYLKEIRGKNWHIITDKIEKIDNMVFCPYLYKSEIGFESDKDNTDAVVSILQSHGAGKEILFTHFSISDSITSSGQSVNYFSEVVLPRNKLEDNFVRIFGGHVHKPGEAGKAVVAGSIFNQAVGEDKKNVYIYNTDADNIKTIQLPGRSIYKLENPTQKDIDSMDAYSIVKVYISDRSIDVETTRELLKKFDGYVLIEQYPNERRKVACSNEFMDLSIENLLSIYADQKKIDKNNLIQCWNKIK